MSRTIYTPVGRFTMGRQPMLGPCHRRVQDLINGMNVFDTARHATPPMMTLFGRQIYGHTGRELCLTVEATDMCCVGLILERLRGRLHVLRQEAATLRLLLEGFHR